MKKLLSDIYIDNEGSSLRFGNSVIELCFSKTDGSFTEISDNKGKRSITPVTTGVPLAALRIGGRPVSDGLIRNDRRPNLTGTEEVGRNGILKGYTTVVRRNQVSIELTVNEADWKIISVFTLKPWDSIVRRDIRIGYNGGSNVILRDVRFYLPELLIGEFDGNLVHAPDYPVVTDTYIDEMQPGLWTGLDSIMITESGKIQHSVDSPGCVVGLMGISNPDEALCLPVWSYTEAEPTISEAYRTKNGIIFSQIHLLCDRLFSDKEIEAGSMYFRLYEGTWDKAVEAYQEWYDDIGLVTPEDRPVWAKNISIYEVHIGNAPFPGGKSYEPYPQAADLISDLPRIKSLGFDVIQLMPHWPFCGYTVHRYEDVEKQYCPADKLIEIIERAHELSMHVIIDIVMHGAVDKEIIRLNRKLYGTGYDYIFDFWYDEADEISWYRREHPEWFMQDEDGNMAHLYTWAFDHANPGFQKYFIDILKWYLKEFKVDGFRFDAPNWNTISNWQPDLPDRPGSSYYASYPLLYRTRREIKEEFPQALFFTEPSGPIFRHCMDYNYNYDEEWLCGALFSVAAKKKFAGSLAYTGRRLTAYEVARWLHLKELSLPKGSMTVHHLDSHDTFWWGGMAQFRREAIGNQAACAMFSIFALIGGGILNYAGAEKGSEEFYSKLLFLRKNILELKYGECDYLSARSDDENIFTVLRILNEGVVLVAINTFSLESVSTITINKGSYPSRYNSVCANGLFGIEGEPECECTEDGKINISVKLPAYGVAIIRID